ncbi:MAG TPA: hypothetical protein V6D33_17710 [Cyanophyceae cyanobacterium]
MSQNLITAGVIDPRQLPLEQVRQQVATFLNIPLNQIERLECWKHQIWIKVEQTLAGTLTSDRLKIRTQREG